MRFFPLLLAAALLPGCYVSLNSHASGSIEAPPPGAPPSSPLPGWSIEGQGKAAYAAEADGDVVREGHPTIRFHPLRDPGGAYATFLTSIDAAPLRGRRAHAEIWVRTQGVTSRGDVWMRVQSSGATGDGPGLAAAIVRLAPNAGFTRYELTVDVPDAADRVELGVGLGGPGMLWMDGVKVEAL
jgi:hypothetical protein